ncbi:hypothetical protein N9L68_04475 [bacterium]|nr:hypothetical protein [bacterium]
MAHCCNCYWTSLVDCRRPASCTPITQGWERWRALLQPAALLDCAGVSQLSWTSLCEGGRCPIALEHDLYGSVVGAWLDFPRQWCPTGLARHLPRGRNLSINESLGARG